MTDHDKKYNNGKWMDSHDLQEIEDLRFDSQFDEVMHRKLAIVATCCALGYDREQTQAIINSEREQANA